MDDVIPHLTNTLPEPFHTIVAVALGLCAVYLALCRCADRTLDVVERRRQLRGEAIREFGQTANAASRDGALTVGRI